MSTRSSRIEKPKRWKERKGETQEVAGKEEEKSTIEDDRRPGVIPPWEIEVADEEDDEDEKVWEQTPAGRMEKFQNWMKRNPGTVLFLLMALIMSSVIGIIVNVIPLGGAPSFIPGYDWVFMLIVIVSGFLYAFITGISAKIHGRSAAFFCIKLYVAFHALFLALMLIAILIALSCNGNCDFPDNVG